MNSRLPSSRILGDSHYPPNAPCRHGHLAPKSKQTRQCEECHKKWRRRKKGLFIGGGEHPAQLSFNGLLVALRNTPQVIGESPSPSSSPSSPPPHSGRVHRQHNFEFILPALQWQTP